MLSATTIGTPSVAQLEDEPQVEPEVGRIDHADDEFRRRFVGEPAEQEVARDRFVERRGRQAVGAGQVEHLDTAAVARARRTGLPCARPSRPRSSRRCWRLPVSRLKSAVLPLFGTPTSARAGSSRSLRGGSSGSGLSASTITALASRRRRAKMELPSRHERVAAGPDLLDDFERSPGHETQLEQSTADSGLGFIAQALGVVRDARDHATCALAQDCEAQDWLGAGCARQRHRLRAACFGKRGRQLGQQ